MNPFLTAAGGTAGAQGPQGAAGAGGTPGAQGAQGAQGPQGASGSAAAGPWDWADPFYEVSGDQLSAVDPALWADASTVGGATAASSIVQQQSRIMRVNTSGSGDRTQGVLIAVPSGDFVRAMRLGFPRNVTADTSSSVVLGGPVYVDGADVSTSSWYGACVYWGGWDFATVGYTMQNTAGSARWESYDVSYTQFWTGKTIVACDAVFVRVGTTLSIYWGDMRGQLMLMKSWTISAGAGMVGVRCQVLAGSPDNVNALMYAYRESLTGVP